MVPSGFLGLPLVPSGALWFPLVSNGSLWPPLTLPVPNGFVFGSVVGFVFGVKFRFPFWTRVLVPGVGPVLFGSVCF